MRLTVGICTWNRAQLLEQTLISMRGLSIPSSVEWELLIVNNNSTDDTDKIIERYSKSLPIRGLVEPKPGKAHALNLAAREARGEYILWTDDDVFVDKDWMVGYCEAFKRHPGATFFGGPIEPLFAGVLPPWLKRSWRQVGGAYALRELGEQPIRFSEQLLPYGANLALRASEQAKYCYDTRLGPRPNSAIRGEEVALLQRMLADEHEGWWVPAAKVRHYIPESRQTMKYLRGYFFGLGERDWLQNGEGTGPKLFGKPRWLWRRAIECEIKYRVRRCLCRPEVWIEDMKAASHAWGLLRAYAAPGAGVDSRMLNKDISVGS